MSVTTMSAAPVLSDLDAVPLASAGLADLLASRTSLRRQLAAAVDTEDQELVQRLLEPILKQTAGEEWRLETTPSGGSWCNAEDKVVNISLGYKKNGIPADLAAVDIETTLVHELGHVLYTNDAPSNRAWVEFVRSGEGLHPYQVSLHLYWLDNIFADARHRSRMRVEHPEHAATVDCDAGSYLRSIASRAQLLADSDEDPLSNETFSSLPANEQAGLLLASYLCESAYEEKWLPLASAEVVRCHTLLRPYLQEVRDGIDTEYVELLPDCYKLLTEHGLVPESGPFAYADSIEVLGANTQKSVTGIMADLGLRRAEVIPEWLITEEMWEEALPAIRQYQVDYMRAVIEAEQEHLAAHPPVEEGQRDLVLALG